MNQWIDFKEYKYHIFIIDDYIIKMKEFVNNHDKLLQKIPEFENLDFIQINRLSIKAWLSKDEDEKIKNKWRKLNDNLLYYIIINE